MEIKDLNNSNPSNLKSDNDVRVREFRTEINSTQNLNISVEGLRDFFGGGAELLRAMAERIRNVHERNHRRQNPDRESGRNPVLFWKVLSALLLGTGLMVAPLFFEANRHIFFLQKQLETKRQEQVKTHEKLTSLSLLNEALQRNRVQATGVDQILRHFERALLSSSGNTKLQQEYLLHLFLQLHLTYNRPVDVKMIEGYWPGAINKFEQQTGKTLPKRGGQSSVSILVGPSSYNTNPSSGI